jgi:hypothetical protein
MIHIEPIANGGAFLGLPNFLNAEAAERYLTTKGFQYTEEIGLEGCVMLLLWDDDQESLKLYVMPYVEEA